MTNETTDQDLIDLANEFGTLSPDEAKELAMDICQVKKNRRQHIRKVLDKAFELAKSQ